jgi:hypothetical protein
MRCAFDRARIARRIHRFLCVTKRGAWDPAMSAGSVDLGRPAGKGRFLGPHRRTPRRRAGRRAWGIIYTSLPDSLRFARRRYLTPVQSSSTVQCWICCDPCAYVSQLDETRTTSWSGRVVSVYPPSFCRRASYKVQPAVHGQIGWCREDTVIIINNKLPSTSSTHLSAFPSVPGSTDQYGPYMYIHTVYR